jgi:hypothetical protein
MLRVALLLHFFCIAFLSGLFVLSPLVVVARSPIPSLIQKTGNIDSIIARVYFADRSDLNRLAGVLDIWEVHHKDGFLMASLRPGQYADLLQRGYRIEIDEEKTGYYRVPTQALPGQAQAIPGYLCYRTVEETYSSMQNLESAYPNLVSLLDIGDSWDKMTSGGAAGYDLYLMVLSNKSTARPKPRFFLMAEVHAREYVTAETALRFAEHLLSGYGIDPDITWLLDYYEVHVLPMTNPDGRKQAETGILWRKNTDSDDGCSYSSYWGTDLNRNYAFKWGCCGGSSGDFCAATYRGPWPASEPEVQAVQNYLVDIFSDQRGTGDTDPAPDDATGILVTLHSYGELVLWPWGWTASAAPNVGQLQTLGRKLAYFNSYVPQQAYDLYATDGSADDWTYGQLGIAAYTVEMGTTFFEECASFENTIYPQNRDTLVYAFKAARMPYQNPAGPDSLNVALSSDTVIAGTTITLTATANDTRYSMAGGVEPAQNIASAKYTINSPSWLEGAIAYPMAAADGSFDNAVEDVVATVDTTGWTTARYTIFVESHDEDGNRGVPTALFVDVVDHLPHQTKVRIKPTQISFGKIKKGTISDPQKVTIINAGIKDMEITSIEMMGFDRSDFSHTHDCLGQLLPGSSCSIAVAVHPSEFGKRKTALVVSSNDAKKPIKNILLRANAKPPVLSSGPNTISFGVLPVTQSLTKTITLTNRGLSDLEIYDISIEDDLEVNFDYVNACGIITQGTSCGIEVAFSPQTIGKKTGILAIISNDPVRQKKTVRLTGQGI